MDRSEAARQFCLTHPANEPQACLCGLVPADDAVVSERDRHGLPHRVVVCRACGLIRADPQPSAEDLRVYYRDHYRALYGAQDQAFDDWLWKGHLVADALRRARLAPRTAVDVGCGGGWTLAPLPVTVRVGYDYDERQLAIGRARGLDLRHGGVPEAIATGQRFDLVVLAHVLEHVKDPVASLAALRPLVAEGGHLYVEVPHTRRIGEWLGGDGTEYWQRAHLWDFQRPHLETLLRRAGWRAAWHRESAGVVQVLARLDAVVADAAMPRLGPRVAAQLASFDSRLWRFVRRVRRSPLRVVNEIVRLLRAPASAAALVRRRTETS